MKRGFRFGQTWVATTNNNFVRKTASRQNVDLGALETISVRDLGVERVHHGRAFYCRVVSPCIVRKSAAFFVKDGNDDLAEIAVYDSVFDAIHVTWSSFEKANEMFRVGRRLAILEPFFKVRLDRTTGICVDGLSDIVFDVEPPPAELLESKEQKPKNVEGRLREIMLADPSLGRRKLHRLLVEEGFSVSANHVSRLRVKIRDEEAKTAPRQAAAEEQRRSSSSADATKNTATSCEGNLDRRQKDTDEVNNTDVHSEGLGRHNNNDLEEEKKEPPDQSSSSSTRRSTNYCPLPTRRPEQHRVFLDSDIVSCREAGNEAFKSGNYGLARRQYETAIKRAKKAMASRDGPWTTTIGDTDESRSVALWQLYGNRSAALMRLGDFDEALWDAHRSHVCAPKGVVKPVLRCADALASLCSREEAREILRSAMDEYPNDVASLQQKQRAIAPKTTILVGPGCDFSSISEAIARAPSGAEIVVEPGVYRFPLCIAMKSLTLRSRNPLNPEDLDVDDDAQPAPPCAEIRVDGKNAWGHAVQCVAPPTDAAAAQIIKIRGFRITCGVLVARNSELAMYRVVVCRNAACGLELRDGGTATLKECTFHSNGKQGLMVWKKAGALAATRCDFHSNQRDSGALIEENDGNEASFDHSNFFGNESCGIAIQRKGRARLNCCRVHENRVEGILIQDTGSAIVKGCTVFSNWSNGIFVGFDHRGTATIADNVVHDNQSAGLLLGTGSANDRVVVRNNEQRACQKQHWRAGHKEACVAPAVKYPSFLDPYTSV
ncbi:hypothetical protein CTAYLR_008244 [Chrysophaeum taylorii]|uniref:Right handed beta helix domain-containing protein n=1 Tax=Chrysophaeum taylorii TaxID=2483200 RepID=A0AAD7XP58_9STRA|nr:hypothetical protein CTAYLR_008244 [Chrysophaeum taylorii]